MNEEDSELFRQMVAEATPLTTDKVELYTKKPSPRPRQSEADDRQAVLDMMSDEYQPSTLDIDSEDAYFQNGIQKNIARKLRRGQYRIQGELDLHGLTTEQARSYLAEFLTEAQRTNRLCVRIIHGKGYSSESGAPVLKPRVKSWLMQNHHVLGFCPATPRDGGSGALYVLLRSCR